MTYAGSLLLVAALTLASILAGRLVVGGFGADLFRRFDPAGAAGSLVLGASVLTLLSIALSAAGLPTPPLVALVPAVLLVPLALAWKRRRLDVLRPRGPVRAWLGFVVPATATAVVALLPVLRTSGFAIGNDTYTYCAFSEWLQHHGFSETCRLDPFSPVTGIPWLWQRLHYDLGIAHLLALVQAAASAPVSLLVYPATAAFGMVAVTAGVFLAARQVLRFGSEWAGGTALVFAVVPHALYWGHHNGFLQQTYALAVLLLGVVLLARSARPPQFSLGNAALCAILFAFLLAVYVPLLPALGLVGALALLQGFRRARRRGTQRRFAAWAGAMATLFVLLGLRDLIGVVLRMRGFMTDVAGGHVPLSAVEFFQFALGARVFAPGSTSVESWPWTALNRGLAPFTLGLALCGLGLALRRERSRGLGAVAALFGGAILYYALAVEDPWKHRLGHTWNVFKLCQWSYPVVLLLAALGLRALVRRTRPRARLVVSTLALLAPLSLAPAHWVWSEQLGLTMREVLSGERPLEELPGLKRRFQALPPGPILVVGRPANVNRWLSAYTGLLAYPRAIVGDWADSASISNSPEGEALYARTLARWDDPLVVPIVAGYVPFQAGGVEELGGGYGRLLPSVRPLPVHVVNPSGLDQDNTSGRPLFTMGKGRTKIVVFSPGALAADLSLSLRPYPGRPGTRLVVFLAAEDYSHRGVRLAAEGTPVAAVPLAGETAVRIPLRLPAGLSTVVLVVDEGRGVLDARTPVTVVGLALSPGEAVARPDDGARGLAASGPGR
ncbi:MAG TPA: hypothetical protein VE359_05460 [Vicinamibacteria bacterium]|nr:hypothetical protein [Vicinamibacteria bacterium]